MTASKSFAQKRPRLVGAVGLQSVLLKLADTLRLHFSHSRLTTALAVLVKRPTRGKPAYPVFRSFLPQW